MSLHSASYVPTLLRCCVIHGYHNHDFVLLMYGSAELSMNVIMSHNCASMTYLYAGLTHCMQAAWHEKCTQGILIYQGHTGV